MITAPFNFVPLSQKVFFPDWSEQVSHDIPFSDGESGSIDITITAKSPILIRDHKKEEEFCNYNGTPYIPSSSVKGMIRNVLEIMSFSKIPIDEKVHKKTMSIRDMTNRKELVGTANGCGFLKQDNSGQWVIEDYGKPRTIEYKSRHQKIIGTFSCDFETAKEKYEENGIYPRISVSCSMKDLTNRDGKNIGKKRVASLSNSQDNAYLVLTGGIDNKKNEFIFADSDRKDSINVDEKVVENFKKVYFESDSVDGNYWKRNYDPDIGIPIFYTNESGKITNIGLSQLFKLAYNYTINDVTNQIEEFIVTKEGKKDFKFDLAQTIFGAIRENATSLKGRVQFSHFKVEDKNIEKFETKTVVLGSPNASFYPEYIEQNCKDNGKLENDNYKTLMDKNVKISGWKRYPLHFNKLNIQNVEESDSSTTFTALGNYSGNEFNEFSFKGKVIFHNLKKEELGALLSALTFHNNHDTFYHNIGMAKSLGFGKIKIDIDTSKYTESLELFELKMDSWSKDKLKKSWLETEQIKELFTMAYKNLNIDSKLKYLKLDPENRVNKFVDAKKAKNCLPKVSKLFDIGGNYPQSLIDEELREKYAKQKAKEEAEKAFQNELEIVLKSDNTQVLQNFIDKYSDYEKIDEIKERKSDLEESVKENKFKEIDAKFKSALDALNKKKGNQNQYKKELAKFLKKWNAEKNHKGSPFVLSQIQKLG